MRQGLDTPVRQHAEQRVLVEGGALAMRQRSQRGPHTRLRSSMTNDRMASFNCLR